MSASPADFELYSRATGYPVPADPVERMRMAPAVHAFAQNYARKPQTQRTPGIVTRAAGGLGKAALGALAIGGIAALAGDRRGDMTPDESERGNGMPTGVVITDLTTPKSEQYEERQPFQPKRNPRAEADAKVAEKPRNLADEGEDLAISILGGNNEGNIRPYNQDSSGNIEIDSKYKPLSGWDRHRGAVEKWADDVTLEQKIASSAGPLTAGIVGKNLYDFGTIATGGEKMGGPVQEAFTEGANRVGLALADKDPAFRAVHGAVDAVSGGAQSAMETVSSWGFGKGHTMGDLMQFIAQHGQNLPGIENVENVLRGVGQVAHTAPIELTLMGGTVAGAAALVGGARGARKAGQVIDNVAGRAKSDIEKVKRIMNSVKVEHSQVDEAGEDERRLAPNKLIHQGEDPQGGPAGLDGVSSNKQSARRDELRATLAKSLVNLSQEQRDAAIDKMLADESSPLRQQARKEVNKGPISHLKNLASGFFSGDDDGQVDGFSFVRPEQQGPATHLVRRSAEREANPRYRYKGIRGISTDPETNRTDIYFRASPKASGGTGTQMRSYYSEDPAVGRHLEHDALDTTQRIGDSPSSEYMMSEDDLQAKSFAKAFSKKLSEGDLLKAVDDAGNTMRADDPWWER